MIAINIHPQAIRLCQSGDVLWIEFTCDGSSAAVFLKRGTTVEQAEALLASLNNLVRISTT
jgi:hypothetical protein